MSLCGLNKLCTSSKNKPENGQMYVPRIDLTGRTPISAADYQTGGIIDTPNLRSLPEDYDKPFVHRPMTRSKKIKTAMLMYNPFSGKGAGKQFVEDYILPSLLMCKSHLETHTVESEGSKFFTKYLMDKSKEIHDLLMNIDVFIVVGGDGTYNEFINGYLNGGWSDRNIPVMFISGGTGNSLCYHIGQRDNKSIRSMIDEFCQRIHIGAAITFQWMDCIQLKSMKSPSNNDGNKLNEDKEMKKEEQKEDKDREQKRKSDEFFDVHLDDEHKDNHLTYAHSQTYWGIPSAAGDTAEHMRFMGPVRYDVAAVYHILRKDPRDVKMTLYFDETEENTYEFVVDVSVLTVMKNKYLGKGLMISPLAKLDNGLLDVTLMPNTGRVRLLQMFGKLPEGAHILNARPHKGPFYFRCRKITMEPLNDCHDRIGVDGEEGPETPLTLEVVPKAIPIVYFAEYCDDVPNV